MGWREPNIGYDHEGRRIVARYTVPVASEELPGIVRAAVARTPHLTLTEVTDRSAHIGRRQLVTNGYIRIVLTFERVSPMSSELSARLTGATLLGDGPEVILRDLLLNIASEIRPRVGDDGELRR